MAGTARDRVVHERHQSYAELYQEFSAPHYLFAIEPDIEVAPDAVDMRFRSPVCAGVFRIRMTKSNVDAGNFFIL